METRNWGYCDLCINQSYDLSTIRHLKSLGYNTIALNTFVEEASEEPKKKKKKGEVRAKQDFFPSPSEVAETTDELKINILKRITFEFSDSSIAHKMTQSDNLKKYDLIAVIPKTLQAFQYACGSMDIDIISFAPESRMPFKISRKLYRQASERGVFFEVMYGPAIRDSTARKNTICTAHTYHAVGKSRNIILTSGAENITHCRGVYDAMNLGFILGLDSNQSLEVVRNNPRKLILRSEGRRCGRLFVKVQSVSDNKISEE